MMEQKKYSTTKDMSKDDMYALIAECVISYWSQDGFRAIREDLEENTFKTEEAVDVFIQEYGERIQDFSCELEEIVANHVKQEFSKIASN